jgi:hypothetical protein
MRGTLIWFGIYCLWAVVFFTIIWPWAKGRIPNDKRRAYRQSDDWAALAAAVTARRGYRCAARWRCAGPLHLHHWDIRSYGWERPWQVLWLCERHHLAYRVVDDPVTREPYRKPYRFSVHWWSEWIFSDLERGLWLTTPMVVGWGKLNRLGRRAPHGTTARRAA